MADTHKTTIELLEEGAENLNLKPHRMLRSRKELIRSCIEDVLETKVEHSDFVEKILSAPQRFTSLPYLSICVNRTRFNIYGFVHGATPEKSYLYRLSRKNISQIRKMMAQLHNPARGREVFLEENVSWLLNLPQNMEIDDHAQEQRGLNLRSRK